MAKFRSKIRKEEPKKEEEKKESKEETMTGKDGETKQDL